MCRTEYSSSYNLALICGPAPTTSVEAENRIAMPSWAENHLLGLKHALHHKRNVLTCAKEEVARDPEIDNEIRRLRDNKSATKLLEASLLDGPTHVGEAFLLLGRAADALCGTTAPRVAVAGQPTPGAQAALGLRSMIAASQKGLHAESVSYTHLTLPTILLV